jgi:hypothetical protein
MSTSQYHQRWMTLVCILGFVAATGRGTARAWSPSISILSRHQQPAAVAALGNVHQQQHWIHQSSSLNAAAKTGWNHNQEPSSEKQAPAPVPITSSNDNDEPRTGWLHNTESKVADTASDTAGFSKAQQLLQNAMKKQERNHRMVAPPVFHTGADNRVLVVTEHKVSVPIYREDETRKERVDLFFTIVETLKDDDRMWWKSVQSMEDTMQRATAYVEKAGLTNADEMMIYLQGGPGFGAPTPIVGLGLSSEGSSWASKALTMYSRILLMDQRGTGRSTPITKQRLEQEFPDLFVLDDKDSSELPALNEFPESFPEEHAKVQEALKGATEYMAQFRADNIVKDAEDIKDLLLRPASSEEPRPYGCALGQSFGGFCMMTYLSQVAHPPRICLLTGGIALGPCQGAKFKVLRYVPIRYWGGEEDCQGFARDACYSTLWFETHGTTLFADWPGSREFSILICQST